MTQPPGIPELREQLDYLLGPVLSARRTAAPLAAALAMLDRGQQAFVLHWVGVIHRSNYELAYQFAAAAPEALRRIGTREAEAWIIEALDAYDRDGLSGGIGIIRTPASRPVPGNSHHAATFSEHAALLERYVCGLAGRRLKLEAGPAACTDTETLFLPERIDAFPDKRKNFNVYKVLTALLWAQCRYGTWQADLFAACAAQPDPERATALLAHFESLRMEARLAGFLPGIVRLINELRGHAPDPLCALLASPAATVLDSLALMRSLYDDYALPGQPWSITLHGAAGAVRKSRLRRERGEFAAALAQFLEEQAGGKPPQAATEGRFSVEIGGSGNDGRHDYELRLDGTAVNPPGGIDRLIDSIIQDLGDIPDDYLQAGAPPDGDAASGHPAETLPDGGDGAAAVHHYDEWDFQRQHYRRQWCTLRESDAADGDPAYVETVISRYRPQIGQLRRSFEMLRGEDRRLRRQADGDDLDFDAIVEGRIDLENGRELPDRLFTRRRKSERNLAALFMVDMSGSTKGWVNEAERESLVMLCEALEVLGDRYAIYGFSGVTRKRCEVYRIKRFDETYDQGVRRRIAGMSPRDYTRMGAAIRHLSGLLGTVDARTRLLVTLSDGKPDDYSDHYRGEYGIEDTRRALFEAQRSGIKPFCITIDHEAREYLPHLYGAANWALVDNVERLPVKVADIYRRLTAA